MTIPLQVIFYFPCHYCNILQDTLRRLLRCEYLPDKRPWPSHMEEIRSVTTQNIQSRFEESTFDNAKCNLIRYEKDIFTFNGTDPEFYCIFGDSRTILFQSRDGSLTLRAYKSKNWFKNLCKEKVGKSDFKSSLSPARCSFYLERFSMTGI